MKMLKQVLIGLFLLPTIAMAQVGDELVSAEERAAMQGLELEARDTVYWDFGGTIGLNLNQSSFTNWAAGGQNAISTTALTSLYARRYGKRSNWDTNLDLAFGLLSQDGKPLIKTDDRIDLLSKYGYRLSNPKWNLSGLFNFRTQFRDGFEIEDGREVGAPISSWIAPAFSIFALGFEYRPSSKFSAFISPATTKVTVVTIDRLAPLFGLDEGKNARWEAGAYARAEFRDDIFENVNFLTRVDLFSNYLENTKNVDVNWETLITFTINEWLATSLTTQLIYDDDITIGQITGEGDQILVAGGPRTQFRQVFALGISIKL